MFKNIHSVVSNHLFMMGILWRFSKSRYVFEFVTQAAHEFPREHFT